MTSPQDDFMRHRRTQEANVIGKVGSSDNPLHSIMTVEVNTTELCNRTCVFCPRSNAEIYPNRNLHLTPELAGKIAGDLASFEFEGRVSFSGFGEPVLNKKFPDVIRSVRRELTNNQLDTNTNGDRLTAEMVKNLFEAGLTFMYVNMYDGPEQRAEFEALFAEAGIPADQYRLRPHWGGAEEDYGLILNNRSGMVIDPDLGLPVIAEPMKHPCYYPFSRAMVDWNGDVLICSNDWGRACVVGNAKTEHFGDIWMSDGMLEVRRKLLTGDRAHKPCATCNVNGTLSGQFSFDLLIDHYKKSKNLDPEIEPMAIGDN